MFNKVFGKPKAETSSAIATIGKLSETLEMLEKKENVLIKKAAAEVEKAKVFTRAKNKKAAIQCLKRKRLYEQEIEKLGNFQLRVHDQVILLEGAKATTDTVDALRSGAAAMKSMHKATNIDDLDKTMDDINEQTENMKQIQEALSAPIGAAADFDEVPVHNPAETGRNRIRNRNRQKPYGTGLGLDYLHHGCRPPIVHRDVKTCNILLNENLEAKVADFGVSKIFPDELRSHVSTRVIGTPGYLDPEYLITEHLNEKSDVYSFGVVLLELMTGQQAIVKSGAAKMSLVRPLVEIWDVWSIVDQRVKDSIHNQSSVWRLVDAALSCVKRSSLERPTMSQVVNDLKECLAMEMDDATLQGSYNRTNDSIEMSFAVPTTAMNPKER